MENVCIHDNEINAYTVNIDKKEVILTTTSYNSKKVMVSFRDVLSHKFEDVINTNILLDIIEVTVDYFMKDIKDKVDAWLRSGFPTFSSDSEELSKYLLDNNYKIFYIQSSLGLSGFVIAKNIVFEAVE